MRHVIESPDPNEHLLERILSNENVHKAWKRVKSNKGAPGVDGITIDNFQEHTRPLWHEIRESLLAGSYQPLPVLRVEIPKPTGGVRPLGIPTVLDRLIQQAIAQVLIPIFDPNFSEFSFGFRPNRSAHDAVRKVREHICAGYRIAVDMDLSKFFDTVNHDVLMHRVTKCVRDKRVLALIGKYLRAGVVSNGRLQKTRMGVPQGGPLSPLLSNILLDDLDKELERRGHRFVRYADDFIILLKSRRAAERVMISIKKFLERKLKIKINEEKSRPERPMAVGSHIRDPTGHDQPMAQGSRSISCQRAVGEHSLPRYGPVGSVNRLVRTRMLGGVGAGGERPPATRLGEFHTQKATISTKYQHDIYH